MWGMEHDFTDFPSAVDGLIAGTYRVQNQSVWPVIVAASNAAPDAAAAGWHLGSGASEKFKITAGESLYIWTRSKGSEGCACVEVAP